MLLSPRQFTALIAVCVAGGAPAAAEGARSGDAVLASASNALPMTASATAHRSGPAEAIVQLNIRSRPGARCSATIRAGKLTGHLPTLIASDGRAVWRWVAPAGAPRGPWRFKATCRQGAHRRVRMTRAVVRVSASTERAALMFPNSLAVLHGRYAKRTPKAPWKGRGGGDDANPGEADYCTWGAWHNAPWLGTSVTGDAKNWYASARDSGLHVGDVPVVGAVFVVTSGRFGHVGVVTGVQNATTFTTIEMNGGSVLIDQYKGITNEFGKFIAHVRNTGPAMHFIYQPGTEPGAWVGHIVQWDGDMKAQKTAWLVGPDGNRRWIPTIAIFGCLKQHGAPGPDVLPSAVLDTYPDLTGKWVSCSASGVGTGDGPPPADPGPDPARTQVEPYANYGPATAGIAMCRGNPANAASVPGGTATQTFIVPAGVASLDSATVQIDGDPSVSAHATLTVNGGASTAATAAAAGDTTFSFPAITVAQGDTVALSINFSATSGKITTVYTAGAVGGAFSASNSCPDGAANVSGGTAGLRATISGWSS
jgi:surface antigen